MKKADLFSRQPSTRHYGQRKSIPGSIRHWVFSSSDLENSNALRGQAYMSERELRGFGSPISYYMVHILKQLAAVSGADEY